jgi:hypothetical protein
MLTILCQKRNPVFAAKQISLPYLVGEIQCTEVFMIEK